MPNIRTIWEQLLFRIALYALYLPIVTCTIFSSAALAENNSDYTIATATPGGTFYRVGYAIAALITEDLGSEGITMTALNTDGSKANIQLMLEDRVQFAILQGFIGALAADGKEDFDANAVKTKLRSVAPVWLNVEHFIILKEKLKNSSGTMDDLVALAGLNKDVNKNNGELPRFSIGKLDSGTRLSGLYILRKLGVRNPKNVFQMENLNYKDSAEKLVNKEIIGMNTPAGVPVEAVREAFKAFSEKGEELNLLSFDKNHLEKINKPYNLWGPYTIFKDKDTYVGLQKDIETIAQPNFLAVNSDVPDDIVCKIAQAIYSNEKFFTNVHASTKIMFQESERSETMEKLPFAMHDGAKRYYANADEDNPCVD